MSLFSRIDRVRGNGTKEPSRGDDSVFAIPDLGAPAPATQPVAPEAAAPPAAPAPMPAAPITPTPASEVAGKLSPLERLARRGAEVEDEPEAAPEAIVPAPPVTNLLTERLKDGVPAEGAVPMPMPAPIVEEAAPIPEVVPVRAPQAETPAPPASAPGGGTAFDRLMAARNAAPAPPAPAPNPAPAAEHGRPALSLAERLSAMRANAEAQTRQPPPDLVAPAPVITLPVAAVAPAPPSYDPEARLEDVLPPAPAAPEIEEAPVVAPPAEPKMEVVPVIAAPAIEEPPVMPAPRMEEAAPPTAAVAPIGVEVVAPTLAPVAPEVAPPAMQSWTPAPRIEAPAPTPVETMPTAHEEIVPVAPSLPIQNEAIPPVPVSAEQSASSAHWAQRLAGRDALRDSPMEQPAAPAPHAEPDSDASEALDRAGAGLARVGNDAVAGEAEARNRALYRQKHFMFDAVLGSLDQRALQNPTRESMKAPIERAVEMATREFNLSLEGADRNWMNEEFMREVTDLGPLVGLLEDVTVNKILVVGSTDVAVERFGRIERTGISFRDDDHLLSVVRRIADLTGGRIDAKVPLLDRPLPDGARIRAKIQPLSPQPTLTVEKSTGNPFTALRRQQSERGRDNALPYSLLRERIQQRLLREFEGNSAALSNTEKLRGQVEEMIGLVIAEEKVAVSRAERASLVMDLLNEIVGLGPIEPLLNDPDVDEVMVNGPFQIYVERKGKLEVAPQRFRDNAHVMQVIERIVAPLGRRVDEKSPMVDGRLRDGSRFNAIIPPLALGGPTMTIRKFARDPLTMTDLINFGSLTREAAQFLQAAVEGRMNIIVSGGTGSGKTTTLNVLSSFIPSSERIVTIEDAAELQLRQEHVVRLETRPANIEGQGEVSIRELVRNSLRMRPDRIVIGECRGGEALDMLQAMNTGHDGSLTTGHSNGPRDTVKRLETMVMMAGFDLPVRAIREQISMAVQFIVHQERMRDGKRRITAITELVGMEGDVVTMQDIFRFEQDRVDEDGRIIGSLNPTGLRPQNFDAIVDNGVNLTMDLFQPRHMGGRDGDLRSRLSEHRVGTR